MRFLMIAALVTVIGACASRSASDMGTTQDVGEGTTTRTTRNSDLAAIGSDMLRMAPVTQTCLRDDSAVRALSVGKAATDPLGGVELKAREDGTPYDIRFTPAFDPKSPTWKRVQACFEKEISELRFTQLGASSNKQLSMHLEVGTLKLNQP